MDGSKATEFPFLRRADWRATARASMRAPARYAGISREQWLPEAYGFANLLYV